MIIIDFFVFLFISYIVLSISTYAFAIIKTFEYTGLWKFKFNNGYIGVFTSPKWIFWWLEKIPFLNEGGK